MSRLDFRMKHKDLYILKKRVHHHEEPKSHPYINYSSIITCAYMGFKKKLELYFFLYLFKYVTFELYGIFVNKQWSTPNTHAT